MTTAQELKLDYFHFYDTGHQEAGYNVALQGQFDKQPDRAKLTYLHFFANPTSKNGEPIYDKNAHLTWYDLYDPTPDPIREVVYQDQFGKQQIYIGRAYALLVPTWKMERGSSFPKDLDHYKVYQVLQPGEPPQKEVKLEDQFGASTTRVYYARFFAVPVKKWYEGGTAEINNSKAHLAIYMVYPKMVQKVIATRDQFSQRHLQVFRSVLLAAPCTKLSWKEMG